MVLLLKRKNGYAKMNMLKTIYRADYGSEDAILRMVFFVV